MKYVSAGERMIESPGRSEGSLEVMMSELSREEQIRKMRDRAGISTSKSTLTEVGIRRK